MNELRRLNFQELITMDVPDVDAYTFAEYRANGYEHKNIRSYCIACEEKGCNLATDDASYRLTNVSHGAHSSDFFLALKKNEDRSGWRQEPVLFVYETPSLDYGIYREAPYKGHAKRPSKDWYWIHEDLDPTSYPQGFTGGQYGGFVLSAIQTFKLANVYVTNLVKCGLNNDEGKFKGLGSFDKMCIENCYRTFLSREIAIMQPVVIFAVGSSEEYWLRRLAKEPPYIQQLPHPAGRRRGFRDDYYRPLYFWEVVRALHGAGIIRPEEIPDLARLYLERYDGPKA